MRVAIDASNLGSGGAFTHISQLLAIDPSEESGIEKVAVWGQSELLSSLETKAWVETHPLGSIGASMLPRLFWQRFRLQRVTGSYDLLFAPGGTYAGPIRPHVVMSRNMLLYQDEEMDRYKGTKTYMRLAFLRRLHLRCLARADGTIFLNRFAQERAQEHLADPLSRPVVIPHGVEERFRLRPRPQLPLETYDHAAPFRFLYVSVIDLYKHQPNVVRAVARLRKKGLPVALDIVGGEGHQGFDALLDSIREVDPEGAFITHRGAVRFSSIHEIYQGAEAFVFASSCENFPNSLLEAMAAGLPIACSDREPMPTLLKEGGRYFEPTDVDSIESALEELAVDHDARESWADHAFRESATYSWSKTARATYEFLASVAR